jgi:flagellar biosynthesis chaperone FliJ
MTQTYPEMTTSSFQETQKQQKKQAKREAKMRLMIEQARGDVRKAEQKMARARLAHELATTRLRMLEDEYKNMRNDHNES